MLWNVKNALNRDIERQHLNKILAEIQSGMQQTQNRVEVVNNSQVSPYTSISSMVSGNVERGISVTYDTSKRKLNFIVDSFTIRLTGDVTGEATVTNLGDVEIVTTSASGIEDAPNDGFPYWRAAEAWVMVPPQLHYAEGFTNPGIPYIDADGIWLVATTDELEEGVTNLYYTDERVYTKMKDVLVAGENTALVVDDGAETITISVTGGGGEILVTGEVGPVALTTNDETDWLYT